MRRSLALLVLVAASCNGQPGGAPPIATAPPAASSAAAAPSAAAPSGECAALGCRLFDTPADAFRAVLETKPLVIAIGEAHAQKGTEGIASSAKRFTSD